MNRHFGDAGLVFVDNGTPAPAGDYGVLVVTTEIVIDTATFYGNYNATAGCLDGKTLPAGSYPMRLSELSLTSGEAILYKN